MSELLSICIPTYQRANYLSHLLASLQCELLGSPMLLDVRIYISDNASTDDTRKVVNAFSKTLPIAYELNSENIGGDRNIRKVANRAAGRYFWLIGDDEYIVEGSLAHLVDMLKSSDHGLVILREVNDIGSVAYQYKISVPSSYSNYREYANAVKMVDPWLLMRHSLISLCVIRSDAFDRGKQDELLEGMDIHYAHFYALTQGMAKAGASLYLMDMPVVCVRSRRAAVGVPLFLLKKLWMRYYIWLADLVDAPELAHFGRQQYNRKQKIRSMKFYVKTHIMRMLGLKKRS